MHSEQKVAKSQATFLYQTYLTVPAKLEENDIEPGLSGVGKLLTSDSFGPCIAAVAILKNGEFAVYHAASHYECAAFNDFLIKAGKNNIADIYIFEKEKNKDKAFILTIELSKACGIQAKCVSVENYTGLIADANKNCIVLANEMNFSDEPTDDSKPRMIDLEKNTRPFIDNLKMTLRYQRQGKYDIYLIPVEFRQFLSIKDKIFCLLHDELLRMETQQDKYAYKIKAIKNAITNAENEYKGELNSLDDINKFLNFKKDKTPSVKQACEINTGIGFKQSGIYERLMKEIGALLPAQANPKTSKKQS